LTQQKDTTQCGKKQKESETDVGAPLNSDIVPAPGLATPRARGQTS